MRAGRALLIAVMVGLVVPASAANLDPDACKKLKEDHARLVTEDVKTELAKGADWAKAHLSLYRLKEIEKIFQIEEQLAFRCLSIAKGKKKKGAVILPEGVPGGAIEARKKAAKAAAPKVTKKPDQKSGASSKAAASGSKKSVKTKKKKPKTSDAYVPPKPGG